MRYYLLDDDENILKILEGIVASQGLGTVVGQAIDPKKALGEVALYQPDIVLVDYLMPGLDGAGFVREVKKTCPDVSCVIISQVSDKEMVGDSYAAGVEFFIQKPINLIEVRGVLQSLSEKIQMQRALRQIGGLVHHTSTGPSPGVVALDPVADRLDQVEQMLSRIGILGEKGAHDILQISEKLIQQGIEHDIGKAVNGICKSMGQSSKTVKQRMRRALMGGLRNMAHLGIEDYLNDVFVQYAGTLFEFEEVKAEMDAIRGNREGGGRVNVIKFLESLLVQSKGERG